jgi:opacity protein-like surface antigen
MKRIKSSFIILFLYLGLLQGGEITKVGTTAAQFLKIGVGARSAAMGESFVAMANDASAIFWNPAGLASIKGKEVLLAHTEWIADISFDFGGVAISTESMGTFAVYAVTLNMGEMERRTELEPEGTGELFDASDLALGLSYAKYFTDRFAFGISVKYVQQQIWQETAQTFAIDAGIIYHTEVKNLRLGMALSNFGGKMQMSGKDLLHFHDIDPNLDGNNPQIISGLNTEKYDLPLAFRIGVAYDILESEYQRVTMAVDALSPNDYHEYVNTGIEYGFRDMVFLRGGYKGFGVSNQEVGYSVGGGLNYALDQSLKLKLDYAYTDFGRLENAQRISLTIGF